MSQMSGLIGSEIQKNQGYLDSISSANHDSGGIAVDESIANPDVSVILCYSPEVVFGVNGYYQYPA